MFYDEFIRLCNTVNKSPTSVAKEIGLAGAHVTKWKNGSTPTDATIFKVCDYFGLPYDYFKVDDLYKKIENLCIENGINITEMCKRSGVSRAPLSDLKMGRSHTLSTATVLKIANYFDVPVGYLLGTDDRKEKAPTLTKKDERDIARDLEAAMAELEAGGDMMFDGDPMTDEARESIVAAMRLGLEAAKAKNKARFTPKKYRKE